MAKWIVAAAAVLAALGSAAGAIPEPYGHYLALLATIAAALNKSILPSGSQS